MLPKGFKLWFCWVGPRSTELLTQTTNSFHIIDCTALSLQHFSKTYLVETGFESVPLGQKASKYAINDFCIPFILDKALWLGVKFTGFIYLCWHHCSAKPWLASSFHPKPQVYLWVKIFQEVNTRGDVTKKEVASISVKVRLNTARTYKLKRLSLVSYSGYIGSVESSL